MKSCKKPIIRAFDLETSPYVAAVWGYYDQRVSASQMLERSGVICAAWGDVGSKRVNSSCVEPDSPKDDLEVITALREAIDEADILLTYNGDKFDIKIFNTRLLLHGLEPLPVKPSIDLLKVVKKHFRFGCNTLDNVAQELGVGKKLPTNMQLWLDCMEGDKKALKAMLKYNKMDVEVLINLYYKLLPFITNHPNMGLYIDEERPMCPNCGGTHMTKQGSKKTRTRTYQQFKCSDCGAWSNNTKSTDKRVERK